MDRTIPNDTPAPPGIKSRNLWLSLAAGVVVWVIHLFVVYALTSLTCVWGWFPFEVGGLSGLQVVHIVVTIIAALITVMAGFLAFQNKKRLREQIPADTNRHYFMAQLGVALNLLFTALILLSLIPILSLPACA